MKDRHGNDPDRGIIGAHLVPPPVTTPPPPPPPPGGGGRCTRPPAGWTCSRGADHDGPCAATPAVKKIGYVIPVNVIGTDDQGRTVIQCPARGCGEPATVAEDGRVVCPHGEAELAFMARAIEIMERDL